MKSRYAILCGVGLVGCVAVLVAVLSGSAPRSAEEPKAPAAPAPAQEPKAKAPAPGGDDPFAMLGGSPARNMVNLKEKLAKFPEKGPNWENPAEVKKWEAEWLLWKASLGSRSYGGPVVHGG